MPDSRAKVLLIGPLPPPAFGVAMATKLMLESVVLAEHVIFVHLDTTDARGFTKMGGLGWRNVFLGIKHVCRVVWLLANERPRVTLLTASAGKYALLRDGLFVVLALTFRSRVVTYLRGSMYADVPAVQGRLAGNILRFIISKSARVIVLGESQRSMAQAICSEASVAVVPNGCTAAVTPGQVGVRDETRPTVLYVGRLSRAKGLEVALRAVQLVAKSVPNSSFFFCGEWDTPRYRQEMTSLVEQQELGDMVHFPGPTVGREKESLLARAWVLIVPSFSEGQPWVILEAMSAGVPVVASDTGAIAETVRNGAAGFVVPAGDSAMLADRITSLLRDDAVWKRMSAEAEKRHCELFTLEKSHRLLADQLCQVAREG